MTRKILVLLVIVSVLTFVVAGCAPAAPPVEKPPVEKPPVEKPPVEKPPVEKPPVEKIVWTESEYSPPTSCSSVVLKWFFDEIEKRSEGRFECKHFWSASLCPAKEQPDGLKSGLFETTCFCHVYFPSKVPLSQISTLPGLVPSPTKANLKEGWLKNVKIFTEWHKTPLLKKEHANWNALPYTEVFPDNKTYIGKVRLTKVEDFKGRRLNTGGGAGTLIGKLGAVPTNIVMPETYDALSKGTIEGLICATGVYVPYRHYEVSDYFLDGVGFGHIPYTLMFSIDAYEALPEDIKEIFQEIREEFQKHVINSWIEDKEELFEKCRESGIELLEFSAEDKAKISEVAREVWKENVGKLAEQGLPAKEAFNSFQTIAKKYYPDYELYRL